MIEIYNENIRDLLADNPKLKLDVCSCYGVGAGAAGAGSGGLCQLILI